MQHLIEQASPNFSMGMYIAHGAKCQLLNRTGACR